jgi:hypothetical protein
MSRNAFDDRRDQKVADDYLANHLRCRFCGVMTDRETLSNLGARCDACYTEYTGKAQAQQQGPITREQRAELLAKLRSIGQGHPRAWAHRLQWLADNRDAMLPPVKHMGRVQQAKRPMTAFQLSALRDVLGGQSINVEGENS